MCGCDVRCDVVRAPTISLKKKKNTRRFRRAPRRATACRDAAHVARARRWLRSRDEMGSRVPVAGVVHVDLDGHVLADHELVLDDGLREGFGRDGQIARRHADPRSGISRQVRAGEVPATRSRPGASHREGRHRETYLMHDEVRLGRGGVFLRDRAGRHERGDERDNRDARENSHRGLHGVGDSARRLEGRCRVRRCAMRRRGRVEAGTTRRTSVARRVCAPSSIRGDGGLNEKKRRGLRHVTRHAAICRRFCHRTDLPGPLKESPPD